MGDSTNISGFEVTYGHDDPGSGFFSYKQVPII